MNRSRGVVVLLVAFALIIGVGCSKKEKTHPFMDLPYEGKRWFFTQGNAGSRMPILDREPDSVFLLNHWKDMMTPDEDQYVTIYGWFGRIPDEAFAQARDHWYEKYNKIGRSEYSDIEREIIDGRNAQLYWHRQFDSNGTLKSISLTAMIPYDQRTYVVRYYGHGLPEGMLRKTVKSFRLETEQLFYKRK